MATIRRTPDLCHLLMVNLENLDWDASERGDCGTQESWDADGEEFHGQTIAAVQAIDAVDGRIDGDALADALETMSRLEQEWGDDPATQIACAAVARCLDWDPRGWDRLSSPSVLIEMLRSGES